MSQTQQQGKLCLLLLLRLVEPERVVVRKPRARTGPCSSELHP